MREPADTFVCKIFLLGGIEMCRMTARVVFGAEGLEKSVIRY